MPGLLLLMDALVLGCLETIRRQYPEQDVPGQLEQVRKMRGLCGPVTDASKADAS